MGVPSVSAAPECLEQAWHEVRHAVPSRAFARILALAVAKVALSVQGAAQSTICRLAQLFFWGGLLAQRSAPFGQWSAGEDLPSRSSKSEGQAKASENRAPCRMRWTL